MSSLPDLGQVIGFPHLSGKPPAELPAVVAGSHSLGHAEAAATVAAVAGGLRARGLGPGSVVGVPAQPSLDGVLGILGILAAGAAYAPVGGAEAVVPQAATIGADHLTVAELIGSGLQHTGPNDPDSAAYVLTTSGTTGAPKATVVTRRNLLTVFGGVHGALAGVIPAGRRWTQLHALSFGYSVWEILGAVSFSGTLELVDGGVPSALELDVVSLTPSECALAAREVMRRPPADRRVPAVLVLSGEAARSRVLRTIVEAAARPPVIVNTYAATETAGQVALTVIGPDDLELVDQGLVGRPVPGVTVTLRGLDGGAVGPGATGEIHVSGPSVASGYVDPEQNRERFSSAGLQRSFATRDLGRWDQDGRLYVVGRGARLVKVGAEWLELDALESLLAGYEHVADAIATTATGPERDELVVVVAFDEDTPRVRNRTRQRFVGDLGARVGIRWFVLDDLPRTAHGKKDREAAAGLTVRPQVARSTLPVRETVRAVARDVLGDGLSETDNLFEVGADSVLVAELAARLTAALGREVGPGLIVDNPRLATLAQRLGVGPPAAVVPDTSRSVIAAPDISARRVSYRAKARTAMLAGSAPTPSHRDELGEAG